MFAPGLDLGNEKLGLNTEDLEQSMRWGPPESPRQLRSLYSPGPGWSLPLPVFFVLPRLWVSLM